MTDRQRRNRWVLWGADLVVALTCIVYAVVKVFVDPDDWSILLMEWAGMLLAVSLPLVRPDDG